MLVEEQEDDDLNFELDVKKPIAQLSISAPNTSRENKTDIKSITETISVVKKYNEHLENHQLKKPSLDLNFNVSCADSKNHFKKGESEAYKII